MEFKELPLHDDLKRGLEEAGYLHCMPVQEKVFEHSFSGKDIYAQSQTGTGKTAAFLISIFHRILTEGTERTKKALILAPTRELAVQIEEEAHKLGKYCPISTGAFYGGVGYGPQIDMLRDNVQLIIGTPGRIIDLVMQGKMLLRDVGFLVIDEADRMFDMGFIDDLRKLIRYLPPPKERQTFLFSATLNVRVKNLAWEYMDEPAEIVIEAEQVTVDKVTQELYHVGSDEKFRVLLGLLAREKPESCLIFCNQKYMAEEVARRLKVNGMECEYIMGDLPQKKRSEVIEQLKAGKIAILVATDVAARGLDVDSLDLVVNYDLPIDAESYVHRIGRTARAGKAGKAISLACEKFVYGLSAIERYIEFKIPTVSFDDSLLAEDKSRGMRFHRDRFDDGRREHGQRERDKGRGGLDRQGRRPEPRRDSRPPHRADEQKFNRGPSAGASPIQRSIADAAGQSSADFPEEARQERQRSQGPRPGQGQRPGQGPRQGQEGRNAKGPREERPDQGKAGDKGPRSADAGAKGGNPYALSSDERMKRYKEQYSGKKTDAKPDAREKNPAQGRGRQSAPRQEGGQARKQGQGPNQGRGPAQGQQRGKPEAIKPSASARSPAAAKKPSLIDRIKSIFKPKKKDR